MSDTTPYFDTSEGQALQWSLIAIGCVLVSAVVILCTAYYCYKWGVRSIKPKVFAGRPVFYVPPKVKPQPGQILDADGNIIDEPVKIPLPVKQPNVHIHHQGDESASDDGVKSTEKTKKTKKLKAEKSEKAEIAGDGLAPNPLALPPGYPQMMPPHSFFHPFGMPQQDHGFFYPGVNGVGQPAITGLGTGVMNPTTIVQGDDSSNESNSTNDDDEEESSEDNGYSDVVSSAASRRKSGNELRRVKSDVNEHIIVTGNHVNLSNNMPKRAKTGKRKK